MSEKTIAEILSDFSLMGTEKPKTLKNDGAPVTIWLPAEAKASYDRLQMLSGRRFGKKAREVLIAAIEMAEGRAS